MTILYDQNLQCSYVLTQPFTAKFTDNLETDRLCCRLIEDDFNTQARFYFELKDSSLNTTIRNNITISGGDYTSWTGDSEYVFNYILNQLNLTYREPIE